MYIWGKNELILLRKDQTQINCPEINIAHFLYSSYKLKGIFKKSYCQLLPSTIRTFTMKNLVRKNWDLPSIYTI